MKYPVVTIEVYVNEAEKLPTSRPYPDSDYSIPYLVLGEAETPDEVLPLLEARDRQIEAMGHGPMEHKPHLDDVKLVKAADAARHRNLAWALLCAELNVPAIWTEVMGDVFIGADHP